MNPMATSKMVLTWICLYPVNDNANKSRKILYSLFLFSIFAILSSGLAFSIACLFKYWSIDLEKSLYSPIQIFTTLSTVYSLLIGFLLRNRILAMFNNLSKIYQTNTSDETFSLLTEANDKIEWVWKIYLKFVFRLIPTNMCLLSATSVILGYIISGNFDIKYSYHPFILVMPWNQQTKLGYFAELCHSVVTTIFYFLCNGVFLLTFTGLCLHHQAFYQIFQHTLRTTDYSDNHQNHAEFLRHLVCFHISVKEWFLETSEVYNLIVLVQLICNMLVLTSSVFQLDLQIRVGFGLESSILFLGSTNGISNLFLYCYFGKLATESFEKMADSIYESNWQDFPIYLQKRFSLIIQNTQKPLYYHGFQMVVLNLETFCRFMKATSTYYMMFKTISMD